MRLSNPRRLEFWPICNDQQNIKGAYVVHHHSAKRLKTCGIGPVGIFKDNQRRTLASQRLDLRCECFKYSLASSMWGQLEHWITSIVRERQHFGKQRHILSRREVLCQQCIELIELRLGRVVVHLVWQRAPSG